MQFSTGHRRRAETLELRIGDGTERDWHSYHPEDFGLPAGWYWRALTGGSIRTPGLPIGPFNTEADAIENAKWVAA